MTAAWIALLLAQDSPAMSEAKALVREQGADGSWNGSLEETGRAAAALLVGRWTDRARDGMGDALRRALPWLAARQREDGLFIPDDPGANAWAALALVENYFWTGEERWKAPARRAAEAVLGMPASDEEGRVWQSEVLGVARAAELIPQAFDAEARPPADSAAGIFMSGPDRSRGTHRRSDHEAWRMEAARRLKEAPRSLRLFVVMPRNCWPCRNVFRND